MNTVTRAKTKIAMCVKLARECSRDSWQQGPVTRREFRRVSREAMADARYWRRELRAMA